MLNCRDSENKGERADVLTDANSPRSENIRKGKVVKDDQINKTISDALRVLRLGHMDLDLDLYEKNTLKIRAWGQNCHIVIVYKRA